MYLKRNSNLALSLILILVTIALIGGNWSAVAAENLSSEIAVTNCVDAYAGGPDFIFNPKPESMKITLGGNCQSKVTADNEPTFLVASSIDLGTPENQTECPKAQPGAPNFIVNPEPAVNFEVAGIDDKCTPG